eukprot:g14367.t1
MRTLVTGAVGFVGYHFMRTGMERNDTLVGLDSFNSYYDIRLKQGRLAALKKQAKTRNLAPDAYAVHEGDVCDRQLVRGLLQRYKITHVLHLAAQAGVRYSLDHPQEYVRNNVECFVDLLEVLKDENDARRTMEWPRDHEDENEEEIKLVYASSSSVYGRNTKIPFSESDDVSDPASLYAATKRSNELTARTYFNLYNLSSVGLRFFTVYGPWGRPDMAYFDWTDKILNTKKAIRMFHKGHAQRDFTYVDDVVDGIRRSLEFVSSGRGRAERPGVGDPNTGQGKVFELFNLGNNQPVGLMDFFKEIESACGEKGEIEYAAEDESRGDVLVTYADLTKSKKLLGYEPKTSLGDGIPRFVKWYKEEWLPKVRRAGEEELTTWEELNSEL